MKFITNYKEFGKGNEISLCDSISKTPIGEKDRVLNYMKNGSDAGVRCSSVFDFVQNDSTGKTIHCYTDGEYKWDDREIYHFEKYNIKLCDEFVNKILGGMN